jgi:hypothetical protein
LLRARNFVEVGRALAKINDGKLYGAEHANFDAYCRARWGLEKSRVYQLIEAAELTSTMWKVPSASGERAQARPLTRLPKPERPAAWARAVATAPAGRVTAKHVASIVAEQESPPMEEHDGDLAPKLRLVAKPPGAKSRAHGGADRDGQKNPRAFERGLARTRSRPSSVCTGRESRSASVARGSCARAARSRAYQCGRRGFDTWEDALTQTAAQWTAASPAELEELIRRLGDLGASVRRCAARYARN